MCCKLGIRMNWDAVDFLRILFLSSQSRMSCILYSGIFRYASRTTVMDGWNPDYGYFSIRIYLLSRKVENNSSWRDSESSKSLVWIQRFTPTLREWQEKRNPPENRITGIQLVWGKTIEVISDTLECPDTEVIPISYQDMNPHRASSSWLPVFTWKSNFWWK